MCAICTFKLKIEAANLLFRVKVRCTKNIHVECRAHSKPLHDTDGIDVSHIRDDSVESSHLT